MSRIKINSHFNYKTIILIALPTILTNFFWTLAAFLDGVFLTNFLNLEAFNAFSYVSAYVVILYAISYITSYASFNIVAKSLGENKIDEANTKFFALLIVSIGIGLLETLVAILCLKPVLILIGANGKTLDLAMEVGILLCSGVPLFNVCNYLRDADYISEKRSRALILTIVAESFHVGVSCLLVKFTNLGIKGVGIAAILMWGLVSVYLIIYYSRKNNSLLHFKVGKVHYKEIINAFAVSLPSMIVDLSGGVIALLAASQAYKYFLDNGVTANGAATAILNIITNTGAGLILAIMPVFSFNYGAKNKEEIKSLFKKCVVILLIIGAISLLLVESIASPLAGLYVEDKSSSVFNLTKNAIRLCNSTIILTYLNFFISSYLISLDNKIFAGISSFSRVAILWPTMLFVLPLIFNNGYLIWAALLVTDIIAILLNAFLLYKTHLGLKRLD